MAQTFTSDELIASMRNLGMIPDTGSTGSEDQDILGHLSAILQSKLVPELLNTREEFFVTTVRVPTTLGVGRYRIPSRAIGNKLRDLIWIDKSGVRQQISPLQREELQLYSQNGTDLPFGYYLEGNYVVLVPEIDSQADGNLEMSFYFRPSDLVLLEDGRKITGINGSVITCDSVLPASWSTASLYDIHSFRSGAEIKLWDLSASLVAPVGNENKITFSSAIDGSTFGTYAPEIGDYLCLAGEAVIPQIPRDLHSALARGAAFRMAEAFGDAQGVQIHGTLFQADLKAAIELMDNRIEGRPLRIKGRRSILWRSYVR